MTTLVCMYATRMQVPLTNRQKVVIGYAVIDDADGPLVIGSRWHLDNGYARTADYDVKTGNITHRRMHRVILGVTDPRIHIDHVNQDRTDNRRSNLRIATRSQNKQNSNAYKTHAQKSPTSRHRGVSLRKDRGHWRAVGQIDGKKVYIGSSHDEEEAARMAARWRRQHQPYSEMDKRGDISP